MADLSPRAQTLTDSGQSLILCAADLGRTAGIADLTAADHAAISGAQHVVNAVGQALVLRGARVQSDPSIP